MAEVETRAQTSLTAATVMDSAAILLNDAAKTDYTYIVLLPYLNIAVNELIEVLAESNVGISNQTSAVIVVPVGTNKIVTYPLDLLEIQEVGERLVGSNDAFVPLKRLEWVNASPASSALMVWCWSDQEIKFNPNGATTPREVQLNYIKQGVSIATNSASVIGTINSLSYLSYKTAALCAMFVGENETRAGLLNQEAEKSMERMIGISNKGKQQIMTRHRPFRAGWKSRGY